MLKAVLDKVDHAILDALLHDARASQRALADRIGLSPPAIRERIRRLEDDGVIEGFTIDISTRSLGYTLEAIVRLEPLPGKLHIVERALQDALQVIQCDKVTGEDCFVARVVLRDVADLDRVLDPFHDLARTNTSIIKSSPIAGRRPPLVVPD